MAYPSVFRILKRMKMMGRLPVATMVILGLNLLGLIYEVVSGWKFGFSRMFSLYNPALYQFCMYQGALQEGQWLRLIVSAFLHFGFLHFLSNMICLVLYGFSLEYRIGSLRYSLIYAAALLGSGVLINFAGANGVHAGASGAIWGLMTTMLVYSLRNGLSPMYALRGIAINLIYSFSAGVSWQGHIGGGIAGLAAALILLQDNQRPWYKIS